MTEPTIVDPFRYRARPSTVRAVQLSWATWSQVCEFLGDALSAKNPARHLDGGRSPADRCGEHAPYIELDVTTIQGRKVTVTHGEWIVAESVPGRFYPVHPKVFADKYERDEQPAGALPHDLPL